MAPDYPSDLIQDIKIRLRQAAGVPSYDPGDPALPSIPSVADAVAALDPTLPDYLRCKRCHGGLFRGIMSTLCIFCGAEQRGDGISRKIAFNSTASYRKMLQSLDLDDSEVVNLEAESKDSSKSQDSPKGGMTLANILNLELRWPGEVEEIDRITSNEAPSQVAPAPVSLSGVDLDNFFSDQKNEVYPRFNTSRSTSHAPRASSHGANSFSVDFDAFHSGTRNETAEQFMPREQVLSTHINLSSRSQKLGFLEGRRSLDVVNSSADAEGGNSDDAFADWETDFQSASSAALEAKSKQIDPAESSQDFQSANPAAVTAESRTMDHEAVGTESMQIDPFQNSSNFQTDKPTSLAMDFRTNDLFKNSEAVTTDSRPVDLIQNPAGFQSAILEAVATDSRDIDQFQNSSTDFSPIIVLKSDQNTNMGQNSNKNGTGKDPTQDVDHLASGNDRWSQISTKPSKKTDQLESISSAVVGELQNATKEATLSVYWNDDDLWQSSANEINNTKSLNHDDDGFFDDWQDFTAATNAPGNSTILQSSTNDMDLALPLEANSGDLEDLEFGCFMQSDSFSVALNDLQSSNHINIRQGGDSIAQRANQSNEKKTGNASTICSSSDISEIIPDASNYEVDKLVAQMPDLSFMLEDSLYVPKIKPGPGPGPGPGGSELNTSNS